MAMSGTLPAHVPTWLDNRYQFLVQLKKKPGAQLGFYPGCDTLQPLLILRHLPHAAQAKRLQVHAWAHGMVCKPAEVGVLVEDPL